MEKPGTVQIADDVVLTIAGLAATEVKGIRCLAGELYHDEITSSELKAIQKCVRMEKRDGAISIRIAVVLDGQVSIPEATAKIKERVSSAVSEMTSLTVSDVDVNIVGVMG